MILTKFERNQIIMTTDTPEEPPEQTIEPESIANDDSVQTKSRKFYVIISGAVTVTGTPREQPAYTRLGMYDMGNRSSEGLMKTMRNLPNTPQGTVSEYQQSQTTLNMMSQKTICILNRGDTFGEDNIIQVLSREGMYQWVANEDVELLELDYKMYKDVLQTFQEEEIENRVDLLKSLLVPLFVGYKESHLYFLAKALQLQKLITRKGNTLL
jgi:hypothetical protein